MLESTEEFLTRRLRVLCEVFNVRGAIVWYSNYLLRNCELLHFYPKQGLFLCTKDGPRYSQSVKAHSNVVTPRKKLRLSFKLFLIL